MRKNEKITALYERLSRDDFGKDDNQQRESNSISNQKAMLDEFAARQGFTNIVHFTDDGISGTCFDRPGFLAMMKEVETGNVEYLCIKDMSRMGRDYLKVGQIKEEKVLIPSAYLAQHGEGVNKNKTFKDVYGWDSSTICNILEKREYLGHTINLGKLSDSRYATLDVQYEKEQSELTAEISALEKAVKSYETHEKNADRFIALIDKYENFDKLTIAMLNEFIEKILVHERDRKGSIQTTQEVEIYFKFVGRFVLSHKSCGRIVHKFYGII